MTPGAIVQLVFRARLVSMIEEMTSGALLHNLGLTFRDARHHAFWATKNDAEKIAHRATVLAHAPRWPAVSLAKCCRIPCSTDRHGQDKKPHWWVFIGDQKQNRIFVPPIKIADVPLCLPMSSPNDRLYKLTFQAPPNVGSLSLQVHFVSDAFVGSDVRRSIVVCYISQAPDAVLLT